MKSGGARCVSGALASLGIMSARTSKANATKWLRLFESPATPIFLFLFAAAWGLVILPILPDKKPAELVASDTFRTWQVLIVLQLVIWFAAIAHVLSARRTLGRVFSSRSVGCAAMACFLAYLPVVLQWIPSQPYRHFSSHLTSMPRYPLNTLMGGVAMGCLAAGIFRIHEIAGDEQATAPSHASITRYLACHRYLRRSLELAGLVIAAAIIGTNAARRVVIEFDRFDIMSQARLVNWALFSSAILAIAYVASKNRLLAWGHHLRDALVPDPAAALVRDSGAAQAASPPHEVDWTSWHEKRTAISDMLMLSGTPVADIQLVIGILAPLVASQLSKFI